MNNFKDMEARMASQVLANHIRPPGGEDSIATPLVTSENIDDTFGSTTTEFEKGRDCEIEDEFVLEEILEAPIERKETEFDPAEVKMIMVEDDPPAAQEAAKDGSRYEKFMNLVMKMESTFPSPEEMPLYFGFLAEVVVRKWSKDDHELVASREECNSVTTNEVPAKLDDSGSFSIPCTVGNQKVDRALCDLGTSVSVIPLTIVKKLDVTNLTRTSIKIKLADRRIKPPIGILKDVMVKIGWLSIPADFMVMDISMGRRSYIIFGRPFLATGGAIVDVQRGSLSFEVGNEKVEFKLPSVSKRELVKDTFASETLGHILCQ
ncbi:uncharacterized protein LOC141607449 [Silene latifolia]|uniref:uncharacterized protein LOC141607449 n=1 Tax=Silene latifolia TaxID=37657 RepID=UPI003D7815B8